MKAPPFFTTSSRGPSCALSSVAIGPWGRTKSRWVYGGVHPQLPDRVAERRRHEDSRARLEGQHPQGARHVPPVNHALRHPDVVELADLQPSARRLEPRTSLLHEPKLVAVAVREIDVVAPVGRREEHRHVGVEEDGDAAVDQHAPPRQPMGQIEAAAKGAVPAWGPELGLRRRPTARRYLDFAVRRHRMQVIEVAEGPAETVAREHLFVEEPPARRAAGGVRLVRQDSRALPVDHAGSFGDWASTLPPFWRRSMLSKRARKFP